MYDKELAHLDALAKSLVAGRPIDAAVDYDARAARLSVHLQLRYTPARRDCSPMLLDYVDLDEYVRRQVVEFFAQMEDRAPAAIPHPSSVSFQPTSA